MGFGFQMDLPVYTYVFDHMCVGRDSAVGIYTRYGLDSPRIESRWGRAPVQTRTGVHPASYTMDTGLFPVVKRPGRGVDHPLHPAPRLKKCRAIPLLPPWPFVACSKVNFTFTLSFI